VQAVKQGARFLIQALAAASYKSFFPGEKEYFLS
jgi:hypothetical protein